MWSLYESDDATDATDTERDEDVDPCEVRFEGIAEFQGRKFPKLLIVRHADREYGRFELRAANWGDA